MTELAVLILIDLSMTVLLANLLAALQVLVVGVLVAEIGGPVVLVTAIGIGVGRLMEARQLRSMRRVMLGEGLCPDCAYELRSLEPGDEDLTMCPECGMGWAVPAAGAPALPVEPAVLEPAVA